MINTSGTRKWGTYFGNTTRVVSGTFGNAISSTPDNGFIVGGSTEDLPLTGINTPYQGTYSGGISDGFIIRFNECASNFATASSNSPVMKANSINLTATGGATYQWSHVAGFSSSLQNPSILNAKAADSGIYTVVVKDQYDCIDTVSTRVLIIPNAGTNDLVAAAGFQLYPNPAYNSFTVETEGSGQLGLKVVNVWAKQYWSFSIPGKGSTWQQKHGLQELIP